MTTLDKDCDLKFGNCSWEFDENVSKNFDFVPVEPILPISSLSAR